VRTGTHPGTQWERVGAASRPGWALLGVRGQAQLPQGSPLQPPRSCSGWGGVPIPRCSSLTSSQYSTGGCWWAAGAASPLPPAPRGPQVAAHGCHRLPRGCRLRCPCRAGHGPCAAPSPGLPQCPGVCGVLPAPRSARGGGRSWKPPRSCPWTPGSTPSSAQHPQPSHGQLWPPSEPPPWGQEPWCPPAGDTGPALSRHTAPLLGWWSAPPGWAVFFWGVGGSLAAPAPTTPVPRGRAQRRAKQESGDGAAAPGDARQDGDPRGSPRSSEEGPPRPLPSALFHT